MELLYAQFEDGSVFGSQVEGDEILALRRTLWDTLRELDQTYQSRGPDKFVEGLKKPIVPHSALHTVLQELLAAADEHGPAQAEEKVQEMLTDAEEHQNAMSGGR
ncbi:MAG TPA: hypothetical protein VG204_14105 [Terriglobia bacterium]|nr:hypothetical protein [Terriglobia bacterium]